MAPSSRAPAPAGDQIHCPEGLSVSCLLPGRPRARAGCGGRQHHRLRGDPYHHRLLCPRPQRPPHQARPSCLIPQACSFCSVHWPPAPPLTRGRGTVGEIRCWQRGSGRGLCGWDRWRSRVSPRGLVPVVHRHHRPPHSLGDPGPGRPQAGLALPSLL